MAAHLVCCWLNSFFFYVLIHLRQSPPLSTDTSCSVLFVALPLFLWLWQVFLTLLDEGLYPIAGEKTVLTSSLTVMAPVFSSLIMRFWVDEAFLASPTRSRGQQQDGNLVQILRGIQESEDRIL